MEVCFGVDFFSIEAVKQVVLGIVLLLTIKLSYNANRGVNVPANCYLNKSATR